MPRDSLGHSNGRNSTSAKGTSPERWEFVDFFSWVLHIMMYTLMGTNLLLPKVPLKMIFLFQRCDILVPCRVYLLMLGTLVFHHIFCWWVGKPHGKISILTHCSISCGGVEEGVGVWPSFNLLTSSPSRHLDCCWNKCTSEMVRHQTTCFGWRKSCLVKNRFTSAAGLDSKLILGSVGVVVCNCSV